MRLDHPYFLYALIFVPVLVICFFLAERWKRNALKSFGDTRVIRNLFPDASESKRIWKFTFFLAAFTLLVGTMINLQTGGKLEAVTRKGADLMICLDVSNSMKAEDLSPNRLERSKQAIEKLIDQLEGDRIGIIVFGGDAYVQLPITTDYAAAKMFLGSISTDMVPTQGTAIGKAIDKAVESFGKDEGKNKAIVIITDGENHEDDAVRAAAAAAEKNITIHTIGMGSLAGAPIPIYKGNVQDGFRKDKDGNTIVTKMNEPMLQELAMTGNGIYVRATNADAGLNNVLDAINKLEKKQFESKMYADFDDHFQAFTIVALILLVIDSFMSERKSWIYKALNLFGDEKK
jgi:Ca-activated chloride channel family protein